MTGYKTTVLFCKQYMLCTSHFGSVPATREGRQFFYRLLLTQTYTLFSNLVCAYISWQNDPSSTLKDSSARVIRVLGILYMNYFIWTVTKKSKKIFFFTCSSLLQHFLPREQKPLQGYALLSVTTLNWENRFPKLQWIWQPACAEFLPSLDTANIELHIRKTKEQSKEAFMANNLSNIISVHFMNNTLKFCLQIACY